MRLAAALVLLVLVAGCGGGPRVTETRPVASFDRIEVSDSIDVEIVEGRGDEVRVRAGKDVLDRVRTESSGGVLRLDVVDRGIVIGPDPLGDVRIEVAGSDVGAIDVDGAADVTLAGLRGRTLELSVDGSGDIDVSGTVDHLEASIDGNGDANLDGLSARTARIEVDGSGDARVDVSDQLDVFVEGAGDVVYSGNPQVRSQVDGAGDLRHEDR